MSETRFAGLRNAMIEQVTEHTKFVQEQIGKDGLDDAVLAVMSKVPRHEFVPVEMQGYAYLNAPLPIGYGKTISQPFIVALMTNLLDLTKDDAVLEVGTGLGYQAAILAELARQVYTVEIVTELAESARKRLGGLGYENISFRLGDGGQGWPEHAPFDKIMVTAAPELVSPPLITQLKPGGRMIIPAGIEDAQQLILVEKSAEGRTRMTEILPVRFTSLVTAH